MALLPQNQRDQAMVLLAMCGLLAVVGYWMYYLDPRKQEMAAVEQHIEALTLINQKAKADLARGNPEQLRREALEYRRNLDVMRQLVPTSNEVPALLEQVSTAARRVGLDIGAVEPVPVVRGDMFDTYRYKIAVRGDYHAVGAFLANVGSLTRIVAPVNLHLQPAPGAKEEQSQRPVRGTPRQKLATTFELQTYVARSVSAPTQAAAAIPATANEEETP